MYFYVQQVDIDKATGYHDVILDVAETTDHLRLASALGGLSTQEDSAAPDMASMLRFGYRPAGHHSLREGSWYDIDPGAFLGAQYLTVEDDAEGALFLRANLRDVPGRELAKFLVAPRVANIPIAEPELVVEANPHGAVELTVVECGHANWNEIATPNDRLLYDVGASRWFTKAEVRNIVDRRKIADESRPVSVVISHWDIDHYHALLAFNPQELAKLRLVVTPSQVPDTATYRRVSALLANQKRNIPMVACEPEPRPGHSREIVLRKRWQKGIFTLFRATPGRSRNQTGIVLGVQGKEKVAILTGDHHYQKVLAAVRTTSLANQPCVLVTPHHGGLAGDPSAAAWLSVFPTLTTPISCGANSYGHPAAAVIAELETMQGGVAPAQTWGGGTWTQVL